MDKSSIIIGIITVIAAIGFGWLIIAPLYKWAFRIQLKNKMKSKRGYQQIIIETVNLILAKTVQISVKDLKGGMIKKRQFKEK